jgi:hypothetical protein
MGGRGRWQAQRRSTMRKNKITPLRNFGEENPLK